jgi:hypothetical protein
MSSSDIPIHQELGNSMVDLVNSTEAHVEKILGGTAYWPMGKDTWRYPATYANPTIPAFVKQKKYIDALVTAGGGGVQLQAPVTLSEEDMRQMDSKQKTLETAQMDKMFFDMIAGCSEAEKDWYREKIPEPFERLAQTLQERYDFQKEVNLKLLGPLTKEKLALQLAIARNPAVMQMISINPGPIQFSATEINRLDAAGGQSGSIVRGLWNFAEMSRVESASQTLAAGKTAVDADAALYKTARTTGMTPFRIGPDGTTPLAFRGSGVRYGSEASPGHSTVILGDTGQKGLQKPPGSA